MDLKVILWGSNFYSNKLPIGTTLVWLKRFDKSFGTFLSDAEIAWMNIGCGVYCYRDLSMTSIARERLHPNQKPVGLMQWCINKANVGGVIGDFYAGSGTTAVACERLNRKWIGIEISEEYCAVSKKRIEKERQQLKLW